MHDYLISLGDVAVRRPDQSLWTEIPYCESRAELEAAFKLGTVHFGGRMCVGEKDSKNKLFFKLVAPCAGMGSALYRRFGSDRFFVRHRPSPLNGLADSRDPPSASTWMTTS